MAKHLNLAQRSVVRFYQGLPLSMAHVINKCCEKCNNTYQIHWNGECRGCVLNRISIFNSMDVFEKLENIKNKIDEHNIDLNKLDKTQEVTLPINGTSIKFYPEQDSLIFLLNQLLEELNTAIDKTIYSKMQFKSIY